MELAKIWLFVFQVFVMEIQKVGLLKKREGKTILFDPVDGRRDTVRTITGVREILEKRMDIEDLPQVVSDFNEATNNLMARYESDKMQFITQRRKFQKA